MFQDLRNVLCLGLIALIVPAFFFGSFAAGQQPETSPTTTIDATRGLSQTYAAEAMGDGRLTISLISTWYRQRMNELQAPNKGADIVTGTGAISFGVNHYMDLFLNLSGYSASNYKPENINGIGSVTGGLQGILPLPEKSPVGLGAQVVIIGGTSQKSFNKNFVDGYDYFLTRTDFDFVGRLMQTLKFGSEDLGFKLHLNEAGVTTLAKNSDLLLLLGAGIQGNLDALIALGVEVNSRTVLDNIQFKKDPLWITPSIQFRTPFYFNINLGADIALSQDRTGSRAIEPFRLFAGLVYSQDLLAGKRKAAREKAEKDSLQKAQLAQQARELQVRADSLAQKARQDSISLAETKKKAATADSLARVKATNDSIALIEANFKLGEVNKKLGEEREKRTDAEKQLLSTGLLLLDAVYFESGKTDISINSFPYLNIIAKMLIKYPKLQIEIAGHTDNVGRIATNMSLSQARAESVRAYLIQVAPELNDNLTARGYGPTIPKASNNSASGRKINRRVELQVLNKEVLKEYNR